MFRPFSLDPVVVVVLTTLTLFKGVVGQGFVGEAYDFNAILPDGQKAFFTWRKDERPNLRQWLAKESHIAFSHIAPMHHKFMRDTVLKAAEASKIIPLATLNFLCRDASPFYTFKYFHGQALPEITARVEQETVRFNATDRAFILSTVTLHALGRAVAQDEASQPPADQASVLPSCLLAKGGLGDDPENRNPFYLLSPASEQAVRDAMTFRVESAPLANGAYVEKTATTNLEAVYGKYVLPMRGKEGLRVLEIGFGCLLDPKVFHLGSSVRYLRSILPSAAIYGAEFNETCARTFAAGEAQAIDAVTLIGHMGAEWVMKEWLKAIGGPFDLIIDASPRYYPDSLHHATTVRYLFSAGLKARGVYIAEGFDMSIQTRFELKNLLSVEFFNGAVVFTKCMEKVDQACGAAGGNWAPLGGGRDSISRYANFLPRI